MIMKKDCWVPFAALMLATAAAAADQAAPPAESAPAPTVDCKPQYPSAALRAQAQGVTTLDFHVNAEGKLTQVEIVKGSGLTREHKMLNMEAARKLSLCPFKAKTDAEGNPIDAVYRVDYTWRLD